MQPTWEKNNIKQYRKILCLFIFILHVMYIMIVWNWKLAMYWQLMTYILSQVNVPQLWVALVKMTYQDWWLIGTDGERVKWIWYVSMPWWGGLLFQSFFFQISFSICNFQNHFSTHIDLRHLLNLIHLPCIFSEAVTAKSTGSKYPLF